MASKGGEGGSSVPCLVRKFYTRAVVKFDSHPQRSRISRAKATMASSRSTA